MGASAPVVLLLGYNISKDRQIVSRACIVGLRDQFDAGPDRGLYADGDYVYGSRSEIGPGIRCVHGLEQLSGRAGTLIRHGSGFIEGGTTGSNRREGMDSAVAQRVRHGVGNGAVGL